MWKKIVKLGSPRKILFLTCLLSTAWLAYFLFSPHALTKADHSNVGKSQNSHQESLQSEQSRCQSVVSNLFIAVILLKAAKWY